MDVMEAIKTRRSVRKFGSRPIEEEKLNLVLEAARLAPSAANGQNWHFIVVRDKERIQELMEAADGQPSVGEAPCVLVICGTKRRMMDCGQPTDTVDCSIAASYVLLEAHALGLGTCWLGHFYADKVKKALHIPEDVSVVTVIPIGYPAEEPAARPRKELKEIVTYEKY
jgi:nitroreductase